MLYTAKILNRLLSISDTSTDAKKIIESYNQKRTALEKGELLKKLVKDRDNAIAKINDFDVYYDKRLKSNKPLISLSTAVLDSLLKGLTEANIVSTYDYDGIKNIQKPSYTFEGHVSFKLLDINGFRKFIENYNSGNKMPQGAFVSFRDKDSMYVINGNSTTKFEFVLSTKGISFRLNTI